MKPVLGIAPSTARVRSSASRAFPPWEAFETNTYADVELAPARRRAEELPADPNLGSRRSAQEIAGRLTGSQGFQWAVIAIIRLGALLVGLEASAGFVAAHSYLLVVGNLLVQVEFTVELILRSMAHSRNQAAFLRDGWNVFDLGS